MNTLFNLIEKSGGKKISQSTSLAHCYREAKWRGAQLARGGLDLFNIERIERDGWNGMDARSDRFGSPWPAAKLREFELRWLRGDSGRDLCFYFDCEHTGICRQRKKLGLAPRNGNLMLLGKPGGTWLAEQDELANYLLDEGMSPDEIAQHLERSKSSVVRRIVKTEEDYSDRFFTKSRRTKGHIYPIFGKEAHRRTLEAAREAFGDMRRGRQCG